MSDRQEAENIIYRMINRFDPSGKGAASYKEKFAAMSDEEFQRFIHRLVYPETHNNHEEKGEKDD
ncbi:MAG: hypothetical protein NC548_60465 [Lachnospiraceae bacterium]|nr:hypothetical protein [Lachnospiraceae bacterium]